MEHEWRKARIGDYFDLIGGYAFKSADFIEDGVPVIKIKNVKAGRMLFDDLSYVAPEFLRTRADKVIQRGDLLITMSGNRFDGSPDTWVGKVAQFDEERPFLLNQRVGILRAKRSAEVERRFFSYSLSCDFYQNEFIAIATSSGGQANLSPSQILGAPIEFPPLAVQRAIANILGALDDKIELNRRMNETLEGMARALFKSWFVDFDPVRAKLDRRPPPGLAPATAALFPDSFQESALGKIPKGWLVRTIDDATSLIIDYRGKTPKKLGRSWAAGGISAISAKNIKGGRLVQKESMNFVDRELYEIWMKDKLSAGDTLMTSEAPLGELVYLAKNSEYCLSQRVFALRANADCCRPAFLYYWLASGDVQDRIQSRATGTTVVGIRQSELRKVEVLVPPLPIQEAAHRVLERLLAMMEHNSDVSETLSALRDALLPKLLSGEIRVPAAEKLASEVA